MQAEWTEGIPLDSQFTSHVTAHKLLIMALLLITSLDGIFPLWSYNMEN